MERIKLMDLNPEQAGYRKDRIGDMWKSINTLKKMLDDVEEDDKKLGLPDLPMGKNIHTKSKDGYVYNKTKIMVQEKIKDSPAVNLLQERVKSMWNSLPDESRDLVDRLIVKESIAKGKVWQGGRWDDDTKTIFININSKTPDVEHNFYHEVGHAKWHGLKEKDPERVKKFIEKQKEIGMAPTAYAQSYSTIKQRNEGSERTYRSKMKRGGFIIPEEAEAILKKNRDNSEDLYQNEIHSELNAYAMGAILPVFITAPKEKMEEFLNAYKEMWDLK